MVNTKIGLFFGGLPNGRHSDSDALAGVSCWYLIIPTAPQTPGLDYPPWSNTNTHIQQTKNDFYQNHKTTRLNISCCNRITRDFQTTVIVPHEEFFLVCKDLLEHICPPVFCKKV